MQPSLRPNFIFVLTIAMHNIQYLQTPLVGIFICKNKLKMAYGINDHFFANTFVFKFPKRFRHYVKCYPTP